MPAPATVDELLDLIQKSGVADEARVRAYVQKQAQAGSLTSDPGKFAGQLVRDGLLTYFQAEQLLQGKWKRFNLGKYKVLEKLGSGGMGQVFLCEHKLMRRRVAIKVLPTAKAEDEASRLRFYREAQAIAAVDHPNLVRAYDIDQDDNLHFLVMEYVDGTNLQDLVRKSGPLDIVRACHYVYGAAVGLQHAHEIGLVHRDIKPGNILVDRSGVIKILDMGLARFFHDEDDNLTRVHDENVLGTADYLAPEQAIDSHTVDIRADIYSLGATLYFLLAGCAPFPEGTVPQKLIWHQQRDPKPVQALRPDVPDAVAAIVAKMMAKRPADRYQTPTQVMAALQPYVATPIPPPSEKELPQLSPAAAAAVGASMARSAASGTRPATSMIAGMATPRPGPQQTWVDGRGVATVGPTPTPAVVPQLPQGNGVWEELGAETQDGARGDTNRAEPVVAAPTSGRVGGRRRLILLLAAGGLLLAGAAAVVYYAFFKKSPVQDTTTPGTAARRLVVSKSGGEGHFTSLREALAKASAGDTIVIAEERISEPTVRLPRNMPKDVTVESGLSDGRRAVIEFGSTAAAGQMLMLSVNSADGFRLRNVELDGKKSADIGVDLVGLCPGVTFENVTVRGVKTTGFRMLNVAGEPGRPVTLDQVRVVGPTERGVEMIAHPGLETRRVVVRGGRFEGGKAGVRVEGATGDLEVTGNRFFKLESAVAFAKPPDGKAVQGQVTANTVYDTGTGVLFDFPPPESKGKFALTVGQNYFGKTPSVLRSGGGGGPVAGVTVSDNGSGPGSGAGNFPSPGVMPASGPDLPTNADDDAAFLRFPGAPPTVGPNKVPVGARR
jgi:serine/threonine protein kinase